MAHSYSTIKTMTLALFNIATDSPESKMLTDELYRQTLFSDLRPLLKRDDFMDYLNRPAVGTPTITEIAQYTADTDYTQFTVSTADPKLDDGQMIEILTPPEYAGFYTIIIDDIDDYPNIFRCELDFDATAATTGTFKDITKESVDRVTAVLYGAKLITALKKMVKDSVIGDYKQFGEDAITPARVSELWALKELYMEDVKRIISTYNNTNSFIYGY